MRVSNRVKRPVSLRRSGLTVALGVTSALISTAAVAQDANQEEAEDLGVAEYKDYTANSNPYTSEGAPYKARVSGDPRRVKPLAETPATITVLTEAQIEESGATDLRQILSMQPGVTIGTGENGNAFGDRYIIRGEEVRSDIFVDGLRDPGMTTRESFAVDQIEITKGPSATFGGRGTTGGAVNSITKQASTDYNFTAVEGGVGTDNFWRGTIDSNLRLSDRFAVRANLLYADQDVPDRAPADRRRWGAAVSGVAHLSDSVRVLLDYYHLTAKDSPDLGGYMPPPTGTAGNVTRYGPWDEVPSYVQDEDFLKSDVDTFTGRIFIEPFEGFKIINSTRYGETSNGYVTTGLRGGRYDPETQTFQPLTLSTHDGWQEVSYLVNQFNAIGEFTTGGLAHTLIGGTEYSRHKVRNGRYTVTCNGGGSCNGYAITDADRNVNVDNLNSLLGREITRGAQDSDWKVETLSVYLMDTIDVTPWLTLHGGVRMDAFSYSNKIPSRIKPGDVDDYRYDGTLWNGHAGVVVKPTEEGSIYFTWGTAKNINGGESDLGSSCGYGGLCLGQDDPETEINEALLGFGKPETSTNLELGTKWDLFNDKLLLTAAAFQITKDDVFESIGDGYSPGGSLNTGKNRVRGIELGLVGNITSRLSGQIGASYMESKVLRTSAIIPDGSPAGSTYVGKRLANFANTQLNAQLRYQATDAFSFGGTATYKSAMYAGQPDTPASYNFLLDAYTYRIPSYWVFDAFASYRFTPNISARVNVTNVGNEDYYVAGYRSGHFLYKGDARRGTLTVTARF